MAVCVGDMDPRQVERLRVALSEALAVYFAYPPFFVYRTGKAAYRPIDREKREQITDFLRSVNFAPLDRVDVASPEVRRFFERLFSRYLQVNVDITQPRQARHLPELRGRSVKVAAELQRGMLAFLSGQDRDFGTREPQRSWASNARQSRLAEDEIERRNHILETTLVRAHNGELASFSRSMPVVHDPRAVSAMQPQAAAAAAAANRAVQPQLGPQPGRCDGEGARAGIRRRLHGVRALQPISPGASHPRRARPAHRPNSNSGA